MADKIDKIYNTDSFNRPPRLQSSFRSIDMDIPTPPVKPDETAQNLLMAILPMSSFLVMGLFYALVFSRGSGGLGWLYALPMLGIAVFTFIISYITFGEQKYQQKQRWIKQLRDYHRLLDKKESRLLASRELQSNLLAKKFRSPHELLQLVKDMKITIWERRRDDPDFLALRLGIGETNSAINIKSPDPDFNSLEIRRAFGMYVEYKKIPNVPVAIDLQKLGSVALVGKRSLTMPVMRALITQLCVLNSPDDVHLYMFSSEAYYRTWKWLRWFPHASENHMGGHPSFLAFTTRRSKHLISSIAKLLEDARQVNEQSKNTDYKLSQAAILLFDNEQKGVRDELPFWEFVKNGKDRGIYSVFLCEKMEDVPSDCGGVIKLDTEEQFTFSAVGTEGYKLHGKPDKIFLIEADNLSHRLLPVAIRALGRSSQVPTRVNFLQLYEVEKVTDLEIAKRWSHIPADDGLLPFEIRLGSATYKDPLRVNLSENNHGPHGLIAGTTGSGKSELLQTLVSSLALEHHPYFLNFMLIDFKGASTFGIFEKMPHVVGLVSNLDKLSAGRALEALNTENLRRQRFLRDLEIEDIVEYHKRLLANQKILDPQTEPLPHLFIIVDEFAQMASEMPEFLDRLNEIARVGRSLGIHLALATQRPAGVVKDEMRANLNFRICLRVQTIDDSRDMLRRPDAAYLPHDLPGRAYFQLGDGGTPFQFQVARAGTEYRIVAAEEQRYNLYRINYEEEDLVEDGYQVQKKSSKDTSTIANALVEEICSLYSSMPHKRMDSILLPPLEEEINIETIAFDSSNANEWEKWWAKSWKDKWQDEKMPVLKEEDRKKAPSVFQTPVGRLDSLATRSQPPFYLDFLSHGGHVMAIGGPQSGKTYFLQSLCYSLVTHYSPAQVHIYILSFAGKDLNALENLPHVGSVIDGNEAEKIHRLIRHLQNEVEIRKNKFGKSGVKDLRDYNDKVNQAEILPYLCVFIDNFGELKSLDYDDELGEIEKLLKIGRMYGLHFIVTGLQGGDVPSRLTSLIQHRIAFNLIDHSEYLLLVGRPDSLDFDSLPKGRCFVNIATPPMRCQIGKPLERDGWEAIIKSMNLAWGANKKPMLIKELSNNEPLSGLFEKGILPREDGMLGLAGIDGDNLSQYWLNWKRVPHFLVGGPSQSGRTSLLHTFILGLSYNYSPQQLNVILIDGSRSLGRLNALPHVIDWITEEEGLARNIANLQSELKHRRDHFEELKSLPEILFVIDDYDLTCEAFINEVILGKLGKHVRQDTDLGFHFLISVLPENVMHPDLLIKQIRLSRTGISLSNVDMLENLGGRPTQSMRNEELIAGRGYFFERSSTKLVQFAVPDDSSYEIIMSKWQGHKKAEWLRQATQEEIDSVLKDNEPVVNSDGHQQTSTSPSGSFIDFDKATERYLQQQARLKKGI